MSTPKRKPSFSLTEEIEQCATLQAESLGYGSRSAYIMGLIRADVALNHSHELPQKIAAMLPGHRESLDRELLAKAKARRTADLAREEEHSLSSIVEFVRPPLQLARA